MPTYRLELTETETACGVTYEDVQRVLPLGAFFGEFFCLPRDTSPALGSAVARAAFAGPVEFSHITKATGYPAYRAADNLQGDLK